MHGNSMTLLTPLFPEDTFNVSYDVLHQLKNISALRGEYDTLTLGVMYYMGKNARIAFNYEVRDIKFPSSSPSDGEQYVNQNAVRQSIGNRVSVQTTVAL